MAHDMELVIDDACIRCVFHDRVAERLPHIHRRQLDAGALFLAQRLEKQIDVSLFSAFTTDPDRTLPIQVTDDDPVVMSFADGDLINTDGPGCRQARQVNLLLHVQLIEIFHRAVVAGVPSRQQPCSAYPGTACPHAWQSVAYSEGCLPASQDVLHARRSTSDI